jgi:hypothetical protein
MGWNTESALGKKIKYYGQEGKVIGVLRDFHFQNLVFCSPVVAGFCLSNRIVLVDVRSGWFCCVDDCCLDGGFAKCQSGPGQSCEELTE